MSLLQAVHQNVLIPPSVWQEVAVRGRGLPEAENISQAINEGWIKVQAPKQSAVSLGAGVDQLGQGEIQAILLAIELKALLLTDDSDARDFAETRGIKVSGTIGLLIRGKTEGHVLTIKPLLNKLRIETNFRMSDDLFEKALRQAGESAEAES